MSRYAIESARREGQELIVLRDTATGATVQIWPGCGNNCFAADLPGPDGQLVSVIQDPPSLEEIRKRPSWWGIPLLFPFPGRIPGGEYEFEGRRYRLGHPEQAIVSEGKEQPGTRRDYHGFVMDLPWKVATTEADDEAATVRSTLDSADHPESMEGFPFPFRVESIYRLDGQGLSLNFKVENSGPGRLPFGFGAHPFFRVPLGDAGSPGDCQVHIPGNRRWDGRRVATMLNGDTAPIEEIRPPVSEELDLRSPRPFVEGRYNGLYTDLTLKDGQVECFVRDPASGLETVMRAGPEFPNVVFWSPPGRQELCFEPWTCPSNVLNLAARNVPHNGLIVLEPGESWQGRMWVSLRKTGA
jgi:aldose 1-epimerase